MSDKRITAKANFVCVATMRGQDPWSMKKDVSISVSGYETQSEIRNRLEKEAEELRISCHKKQFVGLSDLPPEFKTETAKK